MMIDFTIKFATGAKSVHKLDWHDTCFGIVWFDIRHSHLDVATNFDIVYTTHMSECCRQRPYKQTELSSF